MPGQNSEPSTSSEIISLLRPKDEDSKKILKQIAIGGASGWLTGFVSMKVGKIVAIAVGGSLIILQVANHKGYIKVNWSSVKTDMEKVKSRIQEEATGKKADWTEKLEKKTAQIVGKQRRWFESLVGSEDEDSIVKDVAVYAGSFVVGFGIGVVTGH